MLVARNSLEMSISVHSGPVGNQLVCWIEVKNKIMKCKKIKNFFEIINCHTVTASQWC